MILNGIDFENLSDRELSYLINKYHLNKDNNYKSRSDMLLLIKNFLILKIKSYSKDTKSINIRTNSNPINNKKKSFININKTYSNPITNNERNIVHKVCDQNKKNTLHNNGTIKELSNKDPNYDHINMYPPVKRLVAIGDLHGDLKVTLIALKLGGIISEDINIYNFNLDTVHWIGGSSWVIQTGDQIDRCRPESWNKDCIEDYNDVLEDEGNNMLIIKIFDKLKKEAQLVGGNIVSLLGNHELMNIDMDFRYVSPQEFMEFVPQKDRIGKYTKDGYPLGYYHRKKAFKRGGSISKYYAINKSSIIVIGSWLFVHGGINSELASKYTLSEVNSVVKKWLMNESNSKEEDVFDEIFRQDDDISPFWCRVFSEEDDNVLESEFLKVLNLLNKKNKLLNPIKGMIVAHTPQYMYDRYINSLYNNRLWRIDVGMSRAFGNHNNCGSNKYRQIQVLIIHNNNEFEVKKRPYLGRPPTFGIGESIDLNEKNNLYK
ncbi:MAG: hypothetical protein CMG46_02420 [Candidatus Marinimicrobia bacterium]|nr:hypothetical protein [Candidatus Neomarinimicrobiota bacterium]